MGVKVAITSTFHQWRTHPIVHHSSSLSSSAVSRRSLSSRSMVLSPSINSSWTNLKHIKSCELWKSSRTSLIRRAFRASLDPFSEEEFAQKMQELDLKFQVSNEEDKESLGSHNSRSYSIEEPWPEMVQMSSIERKANSIELPLSLRIIKRKLQMEEETPSLLPPSAVKKAFSSMVFMIRELQSFTLHMRELLLFEDLQGILHRVRNEMQASRPGPSLKLEKHRL